MEDEERTMNPDIKKAYLYFYRRENRVTEQHKPSYPGTSIIQFDFYNPGRFQQEVYCRTITFKITNKTLKMSFR